MTVIGIDVSKDWLDVAQLGASSDTCRVPNTTEGIRTFVTRLRSLNPPRIGLEATGA